MGQEVKIGVSAGTGVSAVAGDIKKVDQATSGLAKSLDNVAKTSRAAADQVARLEAVARRLKSVQSTLSKEFGRPVSDVDATLFLSNFEKMRAGGFGSSRIRQFGSFEDWHRDSGATFQRQSDAARHRQFVLAAGMRGTPFAAGGGVPPLGGARGGGGSIFGGGGAAGMFGGAASMAMRAVPVLGALVGLTSLAGMLSKGFGQAKSEAITTDTTKRLAGDLVDSFEFLRDMSREAAKGLGMTFAESAKYAQELARATGNLGHSGDLRTSLGFARAFGIDPSSATSFFGSMRRVGAQGSADQDFRRFALLIGDAVAKSGYSADAAEFLKAVQSFATTATRITLSTPNTTEYMAALAGLSSTKIPGLDPAGAASMLATADASVRGGGGFGQASQNLQFAALRRAHPGLGIFQSMALQEGGLFGTTASVFGQESAFAKTGLSLPAANGQTNFEAIRGMIAQQYGGGWLGVEALKNEFGVSRAQAAALMGMRSPDITQTSDLAGRAGIDLSAMNPSGFLELANVANNKGMSESEKITNARGIAARGQEETPGSQIRQLDSDITNTLTIIGDELLDPLNYIRIAVEKLAGIGSPTYSNHSPFRGSAGAFALSAEAAGLGGAAAGDEKKAALMRALLVTENRGFGKVLNSAISPAGARGAFQMTEAAWRDFGEGDFNNAFDFDKSSRAASKMIDWIRKKYRTDDPAVIAAYYNGGDPAARAVLAGNQPPAKETQDYVKMVLGNLGSTPMPNGASGSIGAGGNTMIGVTGEVTIPVTDANGNHRGTASLRPYVAKPPAGDAGWITPP